jgi:hypothetical protein
MRTYTNTTKNITWLATDARLSEKPTERRGRLRSAYSFCACSMRSSPGDPEIGQGNFRTKTKLKVIRTRSALHLPGPYKNLDKN